MAETKKRSAGFSDFEQEAMKNRAKELRNEERVTKNKAEGEREVMEAIAAMTESDQVMANRIHILIKKTAPMLTTKTWYGMPAYYKDDKNICFFQPAQKFKTRYSTLGFSDGAKLDEGEMWPVAYALGKLTATEEKRIAELVKRAIS